MMVGVEVLCFYSPRARRTPHAAAVCCACLALFLIIIISIALFRVLLFLL